MAKAGLKQILIECCKTWNAQEKPVFELPTERDIEMVWKQVGKKKKKLINPKISLV